MKSEVLLHAPPSKKTSIDNRDQFSAAFCNPANFSKAVFLAAHVTITVTDVSLPSPGYECGFFLAFCLKWNLLL